MKLKTIDDKLIVELDGSLEDKDTGGIIIPDSAKEKPHMAKVVALGIDRELMQQVKIGDTVYFPKYIGAEVDYQDHKYLILSRKDILAVNPA